MIEREWMFPINLPGTIIDIETTGLDPIDNYIITIGYFTGSKIKIYQAEKDSIVEKKKIKKVVSGLSMLPTPYAAYNTEFEEKWLGLKFDYDLFKKWKEISKRLRVPRHKWCKGCGWVKPIKKLFCPHCSHVVFDDIKWPALSELVPLPHDYFKHIRLDVDSKEIPRIWESYLSKKSRDILEYIIYHNFNDLVRSACLFLWDETIAKIIGEMLFKDSRKIRTFPDLFARR